MKVRCGYTNCKNNVGKGDGYFCTLKEIHIHSFWSSEEREKGDQMRCEQQEDT